MNQESQNIRFIIENFIIEIENKLRGLGSDCLNIYFFKLVENKYGYINERCDRTTIIKQDIDDLLKDLNKWEEFIQISNDIINDLGLKEIPNIDFKIINSQEFIYVNEKSKDICQVFKISKSRTSYSMTDVDLAPEDIKKSLENIRKWHKIQSIKKLLI